MFPIDIHTHAGASATAATRVINGTSPKDWEQIARLAEASPREIIPAFGLHPWYLDSVQDNWIETLKEYLLRFPQALVGEIGLDKIHRPVIPLDQQKDFFLPQWELASQLGRPAILHSVKAWPHLLPLLDSPTHPFLCHGFNGPVEYIKLLIEKGAYFSLGPRQILSPSAQTLLHSIPQEKLTMESDGASAEELQQAIDLSAKILGLKKEEFLQQTMNNAREFLNLSPHA